MEREVDKAFESFIEKMKKSGPEIFIFEEKYDDFHSKTLLERSIFKKDEMKKATPVAMDMIKANGYNIGDIDGSGENGRILKSDVENHNPISSLCPIDIYL